MKIIFFSRPRATYSVDDLRLIFSLIERSGYDWCVNEEFAEVLLRELELVVDDSRVYGQSVDCQPESSIMVCYGGDGTLLEGVRRLAGRAITVAGINSGRLGFLTSVSKSGIEQLFSAIKDGTLRTEHRQLLKIEGDFNSQVAVYATNELSVQRHGASMISVDAQVNGEAVATYYGDGVIVSTPTGSTAYSLSAGGPVVAPGCACWIISPLAPHNLTMRPLVVPDSSRIDLTVRSREGVDAGAFISIDDHTYPISAGAKLSVTCAKNGFYLALPHTGSFYETLRDKLMWGVDIRE